MIFEIKPTKIGNSLFATENITKDQSIIRFDGKLILNKDLSSLPQNTIDNLLQVSIDKYLDHSGKNTYFINHSCNPNAGIKININVAILIAIRDIKKGEEITFDYSTTSSDTKEEWQMNCLCASWNCRKVVSGFSYLSQKEKDYYLSKGLVGNYLK